MTDDPIEYLARAMEARWRCDAYHDPECDACPADPLTEPVRSAIVEVLRAADRRDEYRPRCVRPIIGRELAGPAYRGAVAPNETRCGDCAACALRDTLDTLDRALRAHMETE